MSCGKNKEPLQKEDFSKKDLGLFGDKPFSFYTPELLKRAEKGDLEAQLELSHCFSAGTGVDEDKKESEKWLLKGVKAKYPPSLYEYSLEICSFKNQNKDYERVIPYLEEAHKQKYFKATSLLTYYLKDQKKADKLLIEAATAGESDAQADLARRILRKENIDDLRLLTAVEPEDGLKWYEKSAYQMNADAALELAEIYKNGTEDIQKDPELQKKWEKISFDLFKILTAISSYTTQGDGDKYQELIVARCYLNGKGTNKNEKKGFIHMYNAAVGGDCRAKYELAYLFEKGIGIPKNIEEALKWYGKCQDDPLSFSNLKKDLKSDSKWKDSELVNKLIRDNESATNPP